MGNANGFIVLHRKILDWEWYEDINTFRLFVHLLLKANFEDVNKNGKVIKRGQLVTSLPSLATCTALTIRQTRTALEHLKSTGEVTCEATNQNQVITIVNYDRYQDKRHAKRQANDTQTTCEAADERHAKRQQYNNINNDNNSLSLTGERGEAKHFAPPTLDEVKSYVAENKFVMSAEDFFDHYSASGWVMKGGQKIKDWKAAARKWERREKNGFGSNGKQPEKTKRVDYSYLPD